jgi:hypothetical protein
MRAAVARRRLAVMLGDHGNGAIGNAGAAQLGYGALRLGLGVEHSGNYSAIHKLGPL